MDPHDFHKTIHICHESLKIKQIRTDHLASPMTTLSDQDVFAFAETLQKADSLPFIIVFFDGQYHWLAQESTLVFQLYLFAGLSSIPSRVEQGSKADAIALPGDKNSPN